MFVGLSHKFWGKMCYAVMNNTTNNLMYQQREICINWNAWAKYIVATCTLLSVRVKDTFFFASSPAANESVYFSAKNNEVFDD